jgi:hypothetical protein
VLLTMGDGAQGSNVTWVQYFENAQSLPLFARRGAARQDGYQIGQVAVCHSSCGRGIATVLFGYRTFTHTVTFLLET